jgi:hypothetical protein
VVPPAPPPGSDKHENEPPPAPPTEVPSLTPFATHTRRPTRTPRTTATPTITPVVVGALRVTLAQEPAVAVPGGGVTLRLAVLNRDLAPAGDVTLEVTLPPELAPGSARTATGQVVTAGSAVRWYIPRLEAGAAALLELPASVRSAAGADSRVCVLLLSAASPLEHCIALRAEPAPPTLAAGPGLGDVGATGASDSAPGTAARTGPPPELAWGVLLAGLAALGAWLGLRLRAR